MFLRFVVGTDDEHHRLLTGIFTEARLLRDAHELEPTEADWLETIYDWFNANLPQPPFADGSLPHDAVAWFKADATEHISHMWDIVAILREHGVTVRLLRSRNPGKVAYEDDCQVVVNEWRHI